MRQYRISKYNPKHRIAGRYQIDEWTDYSEIGLTINGHWFAEEEYLSVERRYISCILSLLGAAKIEALFISSLEEYDDTRWTNMTWLTCSDFPKIIQDCLRNKCWCKLEYNDSFVHFGYDYYVYISVDVADADVNEICHKYQLYPENMVSPYL